MGSSALVDLMHGSPRAAGKRASCITSARDARALTNLDQVAQPS